MSEIKSGEVRRFFDLLGSIFCGVFVGLVIGGLISTPNSVVTFVVSTISIAICVYIFSVFPRFYWHFVGTKFLYGYFNFVLIAVSNVFLFVFALFIREQFNPWKIFGAFDFKALFILYYVSLLPMSFFWILGIITAWKFSKRETLLK
jgi:hypothetical protein